MFLSICCNFTLVNLVLNHIIQEKYFVTLIVVYDSSSGSRLVRIRFNWHVPKTKYIFVRHKLFSNVFNWNTNILMLQHIKI